MTTDYRRTAKALRYTSNAFLILAGMFTVVAVVMLTTGELIPGLAVLTAAVILTTSGLSIRMSAREYAALGRSQSRMTTWNRHNTRSI